MKLADNFEIILCTYNRQNYLERTMKYLFAPDSPVKDIGITVVDNHSDDGTFEYMSRFAENHKNITYIRNRRNCDGGTFWRSIDMVTKKYFWLLGDDDVYDWSGWKEVETAMENDEDLICVADYIIKDRNDLALVVSQLGFIPAGIFKTANVTEEVFVNIVFNVYIMFHTLPIVCNILNRGKKIYLPQRAVVLNGLFSPEKLPRRNLDLTYTKYFDKEALYPRNKTLNFGVGYINAIAGLKDKKLKERCVYAAQTFQGWSFNKFVKDLINNHLNDAEYLANIADVYANSGFWQRITIIKHIILYPLKKTVEFIFSVKNKGDKKVITIFGLKIKLNRKNHAAV